MSPIINATEGPDTTRTRAFRGRVSQNRQQGRSQYAHWRDAAAPATSGRMIQPSVSGQNHLSPKTSRCRKLRASPRGSREDRPHVASEIASSTTPGHRQRTACRRRSRPPPPHQASRSRRRLAGRMEHADNQRCSNQMRLQPRHRRSAHEGHCPQGYESQEAGPLELGGEPDHYRIASSMIARAASRARGIPTAARPTWGWWRLSSRPGRWRVEGDVGILGGKRGPAHDPGREDDEAAEGELPHRSSGGATRRIPQRVGTIRGARAPALPEEP